MYRQIFARTYLAVRECFVPPRRRDTQEEIIADLHTCVEQLTLRIEEMEGRAQQCKRQAMTHMRLSKREGAGPLREMRRARMYMEDRARILAELDKAQRMMHMLRAQIDSIVSSNVDMLIVDTMRVYNSTAARMHMPQRTTEIEHLGDELSDRQSEISSLQDALANVALAAGPTREDSTAEDDALMEELESLLAHEAGEGGGSGGRAASQVEEAPVAQREKVEVAEAEPEEEAAEEEEEPRRPMMMTE
jgi:hypothetical protein